jgi:peptidoglycan-associated lipoprotein
MNVMNARSMLALPVLSAVLILGSGCAHEATAPTHTAMKLRTQAPPPQTTTMTVAQNTNTSNVGISPEIAQACKIDFNNVSRAPKFNFDDASLEPQDMSVLQQIATCVTTGPLKGRDLKLTGRADPRGEVEYNFALGEHRANAVDNYLAQLGVDRNEISETSRGKLDATGTDEAGWQRDRRVDISLQ